MIILRQFARQGFIYLMQINVLLTMVKEILIKKNKLTPEMKKHRFKGIKNAQKYTKE